MKIIYLDNFRGFSNTFIPIENVNFLIGENSSGKSSLLALINLLSSPKFFWLTNDFNSEECELGNFDDLVSSENESRGHFTIGHLTSYDANHNHPKKEKNKDETLGIVLTYVEKNGKPRLSKISYLHGSSIVHAKITNKTLAYTSDSYTKKHPMNYEEFQEVVKAHLLIDKKLKSLKKAKLPKNMITNLSDAPLWMITDYIGKELRSKNKDQFNQLSFPFPHRAEELIWIAPIREKPRRTYDNLKSGFSPEGTHTPHMLNEILNGQNKESSQKLSEALKNFGAESGLFKEIQTKRYGNDSTAPFEIDVVLSKNPLKITNVGYGVAQVLPIIVESFSRRKRTMFAIQQPEVHLHPKAQAALGEFFCNLAVSENKQFLIETHSDFLIDRFRLNLSKVKKEKIKSQVLFFERTIDGNKCYPIEILGNGQYAENQPVSFRDFFIGEQINMLEL